MEQFSADFSVFDLRDPADNAVFTSQLLRGQGSAGRVRSIIQSAVRSVVREQNYIDLDYQACYAKYYYRRHNDADRRCERLHFFGEHVRAKDLRRLPDRLRDSYLGFLVKRPLPGAELGRSILSARLAAPSDPSLEVYITCEAKHRVNLAGNEVEFLGVPWIQQDTLASACASAAIWVASCHMSHKFSPDFRLFSTPEITELAVSNDGARGRPPGLTIDQVAFALRHMGYDPLVYSARDLRTPAEAKRATYVYVESGVPVIAALYFPGRGGHAVTLVGHTFERVSARDLPSEKLNGMTVARTSDCVPEFVAQDDAAGPFELLEFADWADQRLTFSKQQRETLESGYICPVFVRSGQGAPQIALLMALAIPLPAGIVLDAKHAESKAMWSVHALRQNGWISPPSPLILRTFLHPSNFLKQSWGTGMPVSLARELRTHLMSRWIWVTEAYDSRGLRRGRALGHIIQDPAAQPLTFDLGDLLVLHWQPGLYAGFRPDGKLHSAKISYRSFPRYERDSYPPIFHLTTGQPI